MLGGIAGDAGHRLDGLDRILADGGLVGGHRRIGAVKHGIGAIGGLCTRRNRRMHHGAENLGRHDDRLGVLAGQLDAALGDQRHLFERHFHSHVTTGDHDAVEHFDDILEVLHGLRLFDLGHDRDAAPFFVHDLMGAVDVGRETHERHGDDVSAGLDGPTQVVLILLGQRRQRHRDTREVDALVARDRAGDNDLGVHVVSFDLGHLETDLAIVDEDRPPDGNRPAGP